ncbi:hypothetical protein BGW36DRAFT_449101 [Talaromyces proteolyticus]|uniref:Uncharacterized protein n=1 Tax=Talaromyces proteolyticus TaxID=1131652 RepID=A0AAD4KXI7_9EURO|nr:uncharacterized protein BGW36DRAFT_449101 [Talaromyces proteolyticus]KAH8698992.1 hypothetical protein BGW36DRAFT_449101 [Talaromyces proteolyticus]
MAAPVFTNLSPLSTEREIKNLSGYPRLKPAYILKVSLQRELLFWLFITLREGVDN